LSVEHGRDRLIVKRGQLGAVSRVTLVVIEHEIVKFALAARCRFDFPEQESTERITLHQAVEQTPDLLRLPHEFTLDRWQYVVRLLDTTQGCRNCSAWFVRLLSWVLPSLGRLSPW
jgi:hypothetical protein